MDRKKINSNIIDIVFKLDMQIKLLYANKMYAKR